MGLTKEEAIREAERCLGLRTCESCETCGLLCPDLCITKNEKTGEVQIDLDYCKGCGICSVVCPKGAIQMVLEEV
jgi:2-oxoacid:acceptor oxidoreductase delta subunit (pyruvate/2-ketoisovalerate family)